MSEITNSFELDMDPELYDYINVLLDEMIGNHELLTNDSLLGRNIRTSEDYRQTLRPVS